MVVIPLAEWWGEIENKLNLSSSLKNMDKLTKQMTCVGNPLRVVDKQGLSWVGLWCFSKL